MRRSFLKLISLVVALFVFWPHYEFMDDAYQGSLWTYPAGGKRVEAYGMTGGVAFRVGPLLSSPRSLDWHRIRLGLCFRAVTIDLRLGPAIAQMRADSPFVLANGVIGAAAGLIVAGVAGMIRLGRSPQLKDGETEGD